MYDTNSVRLFLVVTLMVLLNACASDFDDHQFIEKYEEGTRWCIVDSEGDRREWCLTAGEMGYAETWHRKDVALELIGKTSIISTPRTDNISDCIRFLVDRTDKAKVEVWVDYYENDYWVDNSDLTPPAVDEGYGDDTYQSRYAADRESISVDADNWEAVEITWPTPPDWADEVSMHIVKKGTGSVFLRNIETVYCGEEQSERSIYRYHKDVGTECDKDSECDKNQYCSEVFPSIDSESPEKKCGLCENDDDCGGISICGLDTTNNYEDGYDVFRSCVVPKSKFLGASCAVDEECADEICNEGVCSACSDDKDCENEGECTRQEEWEPFQCDPGQQQYKEGARCFIDDDCDSNFCIPDVPSEYAYNWNAYYIYLDENEETRPPDNRVIPYGICADKPEDDEDV